MENLRGRWGQVMTPQAETLLVLACPEFVQVLGPLHALHTTTFTIFKRWWTFPSTLILVSGCLWHLPEAWDYPANCDGHHPRTTVA
jgi:hypothetical protein